jgi:hypothetical protein
MRERRQLGTQLRRANGTWMVVVMAHSTQPGEDHGREVIVKRGKRLIVIEAVCAAERLDGGRPYPPVGIGEGQRHLGYVSGFQTKAGKGLNGARANPRIRIASGTLQDGPCPAGSSGTQQANGVRANMPIMLSEGAAHEVASGGDPA